MCQTACAPRFLPAMISGGTGEGAHARHEAARVHRAVRRRGSGVAGRGGAQQSERMRRIGMLESLKADDKEAQARISAFAQGLKELGWTEGRNVQIDVRFGPDNATLRKHAAEMVALAPDVILASGSATTGPLLQVTHTVPIVFVIVPDPVGAGFVASSARPGGNATGFTPPSNSASARSGWSCSRRSCRA